MSDCNKTKQHRPEERVKDLGEIPEITDDTSWADIDLSMLEDIAFSDFTRRAPEKSAPIKTK